MTKEKLFLIIALAVVCLFSAIFITGKITDSQDIKKYKKGIELYNTKDYQNAYYNFSRISLFSTLKPVALFRQARCATYLGDKKSAIKNYSIILHRYSEPYIYSLSEYYLAEILYENGDCSKAKKHFKHLNKKYPEKEVAIASKYYLGKIDKNPDYLIEYITLSPKGRFAKNSIETLKEIKPETTQGENLIIASSALLTENYKTALLYYPETVLSKSWCGYAKALFKSGRTGEGKNLVIKGLKLYSHSADEKNIIELIDLFLATSTDKLNTLQSLYKVNPDAKGSDYILYLIAQYSPQKDRLKIYERIYKHYPTSLYAAESLFHVFYAKVNAKNYDNAIKFGNAHLKKYSNTNSAPAVMFWMGKIYENQNKNILAKNYYKGVVSKYPDSYYALKAESKLSGKKMFSEKKLVPKPVLFPSNNRSRSNLAIKLAQVNDYDFIKELYSDDMFVQSWVEYKKGDYTNSALTARQAMEKLSIKPDYKDIKWRLVYPLHYYQTIEKYSGKENPVIILSILKEESHFNSQATSGVGAKGLMQLMPATANEIATANGISNNLYNPVSNIKLGCLYYSRIKKTLNNKNIFAIAAYNGGWGSVQNWRKTISYSDMDDFMEKIPYPETKTYLQKVLKSYWSYINIYK